MNKKRMKYAFRQAFTQGIFYGVGFSLFDIFYHRVEGKILLIKIVFNFFFFILISFIWGYFEYPSFERKAEKMKSSLAPKEFRCFKCETLILHNETKCPKCGWSWDKIN